MIYPRLENAKVISFDTETKDINLKSKGMGAYRHDGHIMGYSIATDDGFAEYYNLMHGRDEYDQRNVDYLRYVMNLDVPKLGTNIGYDMSWMDQELHIVPKGQLYDIIIAEPLIDENQYKFSLDQCAEKYLGEHKKKSKIQEWCDARGLKGDPRKYIHLMDYLTVREYAISDVDLPIKIFREQWKILNSHNTLDLFFTEMDILRVVQEMRRIGVRIDVRRLCDMMDIYDERVEDIQYRLNRLAGFRINANASREIQRVFDKNRWEYPRTNPSKTYPKGQASFPEKFLSSLKTNEFANKVLEWRRAYKTLHTFLYGLERNLVNGRIHGEFNQLKSDDNGTVTGRFSASNPNLQQVPKDPDKGKEIRELFIPEVGCWFSKDDYAQIEVRVLAHFAQGYGSEEVRRSYNNTPEMDYHQWCADVSGIPRRIVKSLNFGIMYGMGLATMVATYDAFKTVEEADHFRKLYFKKFPFIRSTNYEVKRAIKRRGFIRTIGNRRRHFPDPNDAYKGLNSLIQGSAADVFKRGVVQAWKNGVFDVLPLHLVVHDETDVSVPKTKEGSEALLQLKYDMENATLLDVPILIDVELGDNWGTVKEHEYKNDKWVLKPKKEKVA